VIFIDDNKGMFGWYRRVTPSSLKRLAHVINGLGMVLELDRYGVPIWYRKAEG
jgi:hypothetical protein